MIEAKKSTQISGKYKVIAVSGGNFIDYETGEVINVADELERLYGQNPFSLSTSLKLDEALSTEGGEDAE